MNISDQAKDLLIAQLSERLNYQRAIAAERLNRYLQLCNNYSKLNHAHERLLIKYNKLIPVLKEPKFVGRCCDLVSRGYHREGCPGKT